jgi:hypothetical protein
MRTADTIATTAPSSASPAQWRAASARLALADAEVRGGATSERIQVQDLERQMSALTQEHTA